MMKRTVLFSILLGFVLTGCAMFGGAKSVDLDSPNRLQHVRVAETKSGYRFYFAADRAPTYTVFRMVDPIRLVVDVSELDVRRASKPIKIGVGNINKLRFRQFGGQDIKAGRIEISLSSFAEYKAKVVGNTLVVSVDKGVQLAESGKVIHSQGLDEEFDDDFNEEFEELPDEGFGDEEVVLEEDFGYDEPVDEFVEEIQIDESPNEEAVEAEEVINEEDEGAGEEVVEEEIAGEIVEEVVDAAPAEEIAVEEPIVENVTEEEDPEDVVVEEEFVEEKSADEAVEENTVEELAVEEVAIEEEPLEEIVEEIPAEGLIEEQIIVEEPIETAPEYAEETPVDEFVEEEPIEEPIETAPEYAEEPPVEEFAAEEPIEEIPFEEDLSEEAQMADDVLGEGDTESYIEEVQAAPVLTPEDAPAPEDVPFVEEIPVEESKIEPVEEELEEPVVEEAVPVVQPLPEENWEEVEELETQGMNIKNLSVDAGADETTIVIDTDGPLGDYNVLTLDSPARLVVDLANYQSLMVDKEFPVDAGNLSKVRIGTDSERARVVIDILGTEIPPYDVKKVGNSLVVTVFASGAEEIESEIIIEEEPMQPVMIIPVEEQDNMVEAPVVPESDIAEPADLADNEITAEQLAAAVDEPEEELPVVKKRQTLKGSTATILVEQPEIQKEAQAEPEKTYSGRRMSLDFKDADVQNVLRLIAEVSNLNIISDEDVAGTITIRLVNVPWDQALAVILQSKQLGMRRMGNIVRIGKSVKLAEEDQRRLQAINDKEKMEALYIKVIPINYAKASDMASQVKPLLSERGSVDTDSRTNVVIVKDIQRNLIDVGALISNLDTQTPQVLIEAKIVEANTNFTKELGIQWGGGFDGRSVLNQNLGLFFPNNVGLGGTTNNPNQVGPASDSPNFAVDLPAAVGTGSGGSLGFMFGTLNNSITLNLRLSALESSGEGRVISSPRITTMDNREAMIQQGISIPFETTSAQGTSTQFIDASIKLTVTPHVNSDRSIVMDIQAEKNAPSTELRSASGAPSIAKKEAKTQVLVYDGETTVIGGIFQMEKTKTMTGIPFLSKIPVLGWFFTRKSETEKRTELLIFITPRIVTRTARQAAL